MPEKKRKDAYDERIVDFPFGEGRWGFRGGAPEPYRNNNRRHDPRDYYEGYYPDDRSAEASYHLYDPQSKNPDAGGLLGLLREYDELAAEVDSLYRNGNLNIDDIYKTLTPKYPRATAALGLNPIARYGRHSGIDMSPTVAKPLAMREQERQDIQELPPRHQGILEFLQTLQKR